MLAVQAYLRGYIHDILQEYEDTEKSADRLDDKVLIDIALDALHAEYGIKYNIWEDKLVVLNYSQIDSPKFHPITIECRSLVLDLKTFEVVSRSFDRFFNHGEDERLKGKLDMAMMTVDEKVDGSLIGLFYYAGVWLYRTKSMIMPDTVINNNVEGITWKDRIEEALPEVHNAGNLNKGTTYILELTCRENRVVTKYPCETGLLTLLAMRNNESGRYNQSKKTLNEVCVNFGFRSPRTYSFRTFEECAIAAKELRNLEEGYVLYDHCGVPCVKLKNPAYVAAHHLRGEGCLTEKRILDLVVMNETDEYLTIFPEDFGVFKPYMAASCTLEFKLLELCAYVDAFQLTGMSKKTFALSVKDEPYAAVAFGLYAGKSLKECKDRLTRQSAHNMVKAYVVQDL